MNAIRDACHPDVATSHPAPTTPLLDTKRFSQFASLFLLVCACLGCQTLSPLPPSDLSQPDWTIRQGQGVWLAHPGGEETIGEVWIGTHGTNESIVQFSKTPFTIVEARRSPKQWQVHFGLENKTLRGPLPPPRQLLWLFVADALEHRPLPDKLDAEETGPGEWRLHNQTTGEDLMLSLDP